MEFSIANDDGNLSNHLREADIVLIGVKPVMVPDLLREIARTRSVVVVEHDMDLVMNLVDRLVVMNYGQKLAEGTPAEIRQNRDVREAYLGDDMTEEGAA